MALPIFIAGVAIGGLAVVAFNNKAKIAKEVKVGIQKAKDFAKDGLQKAEKFQKNIKKETAVKKTSKPKRKKPKAAKEALDVANI
ncbi:MAG: hypothetical protein LBI78_00245 [Campylobacteraceae bacterium]|jgi:hypothetical protein|nr:hypothetical protein [Campylobacteraceae bacterium]